MLATLCVFFANTADPVFSQSEKSSAATPSVKNKPADPDRSQPNQDTRGAPLDQNPLIAIEKSISRVINNVEDSVVSIARVSKDTLEDPTSPDFIPKEFATGVVISEDGLILTCYHVLGNPEDHDYYIWKNGIPFRARTAEKVKSVVAADPWTDLAVLKIDAKLTPIKLATNYVPRRGQFVVSLGNPFGIAKDGQVSASFGIISNLLRQRSLKSASEWDGSNSETFSQYGTLLQTDAKLHRGTSGGPLLNLRGEMIGLSSSLTAANYFDSAAGFAIPVNKTFLRTVERLRQGRSAEFGFLGIATRELTLAQRQQFEQGVVVTQVVENTPADVGGLKFGDVITHVNEQSITSSNSMLRELSGRFAGDQITIKIQRKAFPSSPFRKMELKVQLGKKKVNSTQPTIGINDFSAWRGIKVDYPTAVDELSLHFSKIDPDGCVAVIAIQKESPSEIAGLRQFDFVSHVNGQRVSTPAQFHLAVDSANGAVELTRVVGKEKSPEKIIVKAEKSR